MGVAGGVLQQLPSSNPPPLRRDGKIRVPPLLRRLTSGRHAGAMITDGRGAGNRAKQEMPFASHMRSDSHALADRNVSHPMCPQVNHAHWRDDALLYCTELTIRSVGCWGLWVPDILCPIDSVRSPTAWTACVLNLVSIGPISCADTFTGQHDAGHDARAVSSLTLCVLIYRARIMDAALVKNLPPLCRTRHPRPPYTCLFMVSSIPPGSCFSRSAV